VVVEEIGEAGETATTRGARDVGENDGAAVAPATKAAGTEAGLRGGVLGTAGVGLEAVAAATK